MLKPSWLNKQLDAAAERAAKLPSWLTRNSEGIIPMPNQFQDDTDSGTAGRELVQRVMRLMLASSCFGREVCPTPPCACAQSLIDAITAARLPATTQEQPTAAEVERLAARLATHLSVKDSSPGFHLSDEDFRLIISALCATSLNARLATPLVQAPAPNYVAAAHAGLDGDWPIDWNTKPAPVQAPAAGVGEYEKVPKSTLATAKETAREVAKEIFRDVPQLGAHMGDGAGKLIAVLVEYYGPALADREAAARADERQECATLVGSWPTINYGSFDERLKVQQACVDMAAAIRARSAP